jgi:glucose-6-phosphate 1-dehydrogenase
MTFVVFGASGDLTSRKLIPAVFGMFCDHMLPRGSAVVGYGRTDMSDQEFRDSLREAVDLNCKGKPVDADLWERFASILHYHQGQYDSEEDFAALGERLGQIAQQEDRPDNRILYLATPPDTFIPVIRTLGRAQLHQPPSGAYARIVLEKPFGTDIDSAHALNECVRSVFAEEQIYRIDHYLGKETVQNLLVLRFANSLFEPLWNNRHIDHVQITVAESLGLGGRGGYYDSSGAVRDMVQNHMMHLMCLVGMEPPNSLDADAVRDEKVKVLRSLRPIRTQCVNRGIIRAQYAPGTVDGQRVVGYRQEDGVADDSTTETFIAFRALIDNWRWSGVPFYLRTGKRLARRRTDISIHFRPVPRVLFNASPSGPLKPNVLAIRVQPDEGVELDFSVKVPGSGMRIESLKMDFGYAGSFGQSPPDAYQRLLLDAALGDATLFTRSDEVEAAWRYVQPLLQLADEADPESMITYPAGSWGPQEAHDLIATDGNRWYVRGE